MIETPEGFTLQRVGGGFSAWVRIIGPVEFCVINQGWSSVPINEHEMSLPAIVEASHHLSSDEPQVAVCVIEAFCATPGGSNHESGAVSWHFETAHKALEWLAVLALVRGGLQ